MPEMFQKSLSSKVVTGQIHTYMQDESSKRMGIDISTFFIFFLIFDYLSSKIS